MEAHNSFVLPLQSCYWCQSHEKSQTAIKEQHMKLSILPYYVKHVFNGIQVLVSCWNTEDVIVNNIISQLSLLPLLYWAPVLKDKFIFWVGITFKRNGMLGFHCSYMMIPFWWAMATNTFTGRLLLPSFFPFLVISSLSPSIHHIFELGATFKGLVCGRM